ncbi:DUF6712 family protein [Mucilaginibacter myungsuensis]|uniref:Uncharacterized protein n=1 Tax=Mucilaginibacter myungsuensis TaxID=649104 RepID=A0A929L2H5_9SPHI|nr:hypothetical protein [Mucilaginibacter myungsuensis]MBE9662026.1 hypothetical protein [Mucilaginibacter myungsuensis]MDN3599541.1 hypothetical protein [Mucilaginibacter myungsuensis]
MNLIDQTTFQRFEDISQNIKPERLAVFIAKAQELDLKPFLGYALYYDLLKHFNTDGTLKDDAPQHYKDLVNGAEYLDRRGNVVLYQGLAPLLVYFAFARFIEDNAVHYSATGPVIKQREGATSLSPADTTKLVQQQRSTANAYANQTEQFLKDHKADFPLWQYDPKNRSARQAGPRIRAVDRTELNLQSGVDLNYVVPL